MLSLKSISQYRNFSQSSKLLAAAATRKSFNKKSSYDKSKNKKGPGNDKSFKDSILTKNYKKKALDNDKSLIKQLKSISIADKEDINNTFVKYPTKYIRKLRVAGSFKPNQYNELYSQPLTLYRSIEDSKLLEIIKNSSINSSLNNRYLINGDSGIGKSTILSHYQSFALCLNKGNAILFPISNADLLVNGSNDFKLNPLTKFYDQPMYTREFLKKFKNLNNDILSKIPLSKEIIPITNLFKPSTNNKINGSLLDFINFFLQSSSNSIESNTTFAFNTLLDELSMQSISPVFLTIDNFSAFIQNGMTNYRDTENRKIYFQKFSIIDKLLKFISGEQNFKNGSIMIATHGEHRLQNNVTLDVISGEKLIDDFAYSKFKDFDYQLANRLIQNDGIKNFKISKFNLDECKSLITHLFKFNLIHNEYDLENKLINHGNMENAIDQIASEKYLISGNGIPKLVLDSCILSYA